LSNHIKIIVFHSVEMSEDISFDFVVVGGGIAGCVLASRLSHALPHYSVALIEAGPDAHDDPRIVDSLGSALLHGSEFEWNYMTAPQRHLDGRSIYNCGGKLLSGGSAINYGIWVRGHTEDFDQWARHVQDKRWSYAGLLPYFKRSETHYLQPEETQNVEEHGFDGPIHTVRQTINKGSPLVIFY
jgi:choline dehydrogenase-like flavoprotein